MVEAARRGYSFDAMTQLSDGGTIGATAVGQVGGANKILDVGAGRVDFTWVTDVTSIETGSSDELFTIILEGSSSPTFASDIVPLAFLILGHNTPAPGGQDAVSPAGRYSRRGSNENAGTEYRYLRINTIVAGTIATGIVLGNSWLSVEGDT